MGQSLTRRLSKHRTVPIVHLALQAVGQIILGLFWYRFHDGQMVYGHWLDNRRHVSNLVFLQRFVVRKANGKNFTLTGAGHDGKVARRVHKPRLPEDAKGAPFAYAPG